MRTHEYRYEETYIAVCEACCLSSLGTSASSTVPPAYAYIYIYILYTHIYI